jgi:hypothetical protein
LRLLVDGRERLPVTSTLTSHIFVVPAAAATVRLISRATAPCEIAPWIEDQRRLGVAVGRLVLSGPMGLFELPVDHPSLSDGWWPEEREGLNLWRWTNGNAALPLPGEAAIVEVHLAGRNVYLHTPSTAEATATRQTMVA